MSQIATATTTTTFRMVLMLPAMGMYVLISHNAKPTTISATTMFTNGIGIYSPARRAAIRCPLDGAFCLVRSNLISRECAATWERQVEAQRMRQVLHVWTGFCTWPQPATSLRRAPISATRRGDRTIEGKYLTSRSVGTARAIIPRCRRIPRGVTGTI